MGTVNKSSVNIIKTVWLKMENGIKEYSIKVKLNKKQRNKDSKMRKDCKDYHFKQRDEEKQYP